MQSERLGKLTFDIQILFEASIASAAIGRHHRRQQSPVGVVVVNWAALGAGPTQQRRQVKLDESSYI